MSKLIDTRYTQDRELSWLKFNERVLAEARDESVPLMERLKFAAIFTSNLDEFFMIRVGSLTDMALVKETHVDSKSGRTPQQQLQAIFHAVPPLYKQRDKVFEQLTLRLRSCNICQMSMGELDNRAKKQVDAWFQSQVRPVLSPLILDIHHPFPHLPNKRLTIALVLQRDGKEYFAFLPLPPNFPPFLRLEERGLHFILLEDILLEYAGQVFDQFSIVEKAVVAVTRNADISPEDESYDVDEDFRQHMRKIVKKRARLSPVRLELQGCKGDKLIPFLCQRLGLTRDQVFKTKAPIAMDYVYSLTALLPPESATALCDPPYAPRFPACLTPQQPILPQILKQDALVFYPFEQMEPFLHLIREAAFDPDVVSIKITIYRLASRAKLAEYLSAAAENGKDVTVLMELRARFDEQNNIRWAERMEEAGCTILYGSEGLKVHSKICLITRKAKGGIQYITQIGTGNYNEKTARLYTDLCLMTANQAIGADAAAFFQNMAISNFAGNYHLLLASPLGLRTKVMALIDREIAKGPRGYIFLKLNSITDRQLIDKLAQASQAGVTVVMNVRGICCLMPGIPDLTDHITVFSIVGRYLEHSRIYQFGQGEDADLYLSSADFMTRNTERRVEIACPVLDPWCRKRLFHIIQELQRDNVKARELKPGGSYHPRVSQEDPRCCQEVFQSETVQPPVPARTATAALPHAPSLFSRLRKAVEGKSPRKKSRS
jgi:polyphosphate kinase